LQKVKKKIKFLGKENSESDLMKALTKAMIKHQPKNVKKYKFDDSPIIEIDSEKSFKTSITLRKGLSTNNSESTCCICYSKNPK